MTQLIQNAACGGAMILAVALLRRVLKDRLAPGARLALWAACLFRLLAPAVPKSALSLWGLFAPQKQTAAPTLPVTGYVPPAAITPAPTPQPDPGISWGIVLTVLWIVGSAALAVWYALSWLRTRRAVACASPVGRDDPRYMDLPKCARLREGPMAGAPLTFGALRPTVVLPPGLDGPGLDCVLAHEGVHAARRDNLWHYAMALALIVHWWNPAVWLMSRLLRRDIELSCDRAAVRKLGMDRRTEYAQALVSLATQGSGPAFCHTFGQKAAEERIRTVMKFKKTTIVGIIFSLALVLALTAAFASEPKAPENDTVEFQGQTFARSDLSQETLDWLDWYLALPEEEQLAVSYVPAELRPEQAPETDDGPDSDKTGTSQIASIPNADATKNIQSDVPEINPDDVDLDAEKERLAQMVVDGKLTQEAADSILAGLKGMLEKARRGELKLFKYTDKDGYEFYYGSGVGTMYYEDEDGNLVDPGRIYSGYYKTYLPIVDENGVSRVYDDDGDLVIVGTPSEPAYEEEDAKDLEGSSDPLQGSGYVSYDGQPPVAVGNDGSVSSAAPQATPAQPKTNTNTTPVPACGVAGCTETRRHQHVGGQCVLLGDPCPVEGCTIPGCHDHGDGIVYGCNGYHSGGVCDGSCLVWNQSGQTATSDPNAAIDNSVSTPIRSGCYSGGHHGSGHHGWHH